MCNQESRIINSYMPPYPATLPYRGMGVLHVLTMDGTGKYAMYTGIVGTQDNRTKAEEWVWGNGQKATRAVALSNFSFEEELYRD